MARPLCDDTTKAGSPCANKAKAGETKCASHLATVGRKGKLATAMPKIVDALEIGNSRKGAIGYAGIGETTFYSWLEKGEADIEQGRPSQEREFREAVLLAEGRAEHSLVAEVRRSASGFVNPTTREREGKDWRAAAFLLERRYPDCWGPHQTVKHTGDGGVRRARIEVPLDSDRLAEVAEILRTGGVLPTDSTTDPKEGDS